VRPEQPGLLNQHDPATFCDLKNAEACHLNRQTSTLWPLHQDQYNVRNLTTGFSIMRLYCEQRSNELLDVHLPSAGSAFFQTPTIFERRVKPRSTDNFSARVWGVDTEDEAFAFDCKIENISRSGVYLAMPWQVKLFSTISLVVHLSKSPEARVTAAIKGIVMRNDLQRDGQHGVAVRINEHTFL
jgi:PilZ domain